VNGLSDPLSQFRRKPSPTSTANGASAKRTYEAHDKTGKPSPYMEICCVTQASQSLQSRFFMAAVFSADFDNAITLIYSFMAVEVRGRNLAPVRQAIQTDRCEFIQEFHPNEFTAPGKNEPVIESIRFITDEKMDDILASHRTGA